MKRYVVIDLDEHQILGIVEDYGVADAYSSWLVGRLNHCISVTELDENDQEEIVRFILGLDVGEV